MKRFGNSELRLRKHKRLDSGFGTGYRFSERSAEPDSALKRTSRAATTRGRTPSATFNPLFPKGNLFWRSRHGWTRPHQLY